MSDADLNFEFVNRTWLEYTGTTQAGNAGRRRTERVIDEDRDLVTGDIDRAVVDAAPFRIGFRFRRDDGSVRQGLFHGVPRHDATGRLVGFAGTVVDVTALSRSHDELRRHRDELEATVGPLADGMRAAHQQLRTLLDEPSPEPVAVGTQAIVIDQARDGMRAAKERFDTDFTAILTETQRAIYQALQEARPDRGGFSGHRGRRGSSGPGGPGGGYGLGVPGSNGPRG